MNEQVASAAELDALPPLQLMVLEVLAARYRLGEVLWTFTAHTSTVRAIRALETAGLVTSMGGIVPRTIRASLTPSGVAAATSPTYRVPDQPQRVQPSREDVARTWHEAGNGAGSWDRCTDRIRERSLFRIDAVLALFAQQPTVAEVARNAWDEGYYAGVSDYRLGKWYPTNTGAEAWPDRRKLTPNPHRLAPQSHEADRIEREARP